MSGVDTDFTPPPPPPSSLFAPFRVLPSCASALVSLEGLRKGPSVGGGAAAAAAAFSGDAWVSGIETKLAVVVAVGGGGASVGFSFRLRPPRRHVAGPRRSCGGAWVSGMAASARKSSSGAGFAGGGGGGGGDRVNRAELFEIVVARLGDSEGAGGGDEGCRGSEWQEGGVSGAQTFFVRQKRRVNTKERWQARRHGEG